MKRRNDQLVLDQLDIPTSPSPSSKRSRTGTANDQTEVMNINTWVSATSVRNYMIDDPILDWLKYYKHLVNLPAHHPFVHRPFDTFTDYIINKGIEFEKAVYSKLKAKFPNDIVSVSTNYNDIISTEKVTETINLMKKGTPIIYNGVLHNPENQTYGAADLIVRSDWLNRIVPGTISKEEAKIPAPKLGTPYHYCIIDIKYQLLHLKADGRHLLNNGYIPAYKAQVIIYTWALRQIQGHLPTKAYLLGRGYTYTSKGVNYGGTACFDKLGEVDMTESGSDSMYLNKTVDAINWVKEVRSVGGSWTVLPKPTREELYPNMCNTRDGQFAKIKRDIANQLDEITLLWQCGPKHRQNAFRRQIYKWSDPRCSANILGHKGEVIGPIVQQMLDFNREVIEKGKVVIPDIIKNDQSNWKTAKPLELFFDLEIITNVFDQLDQIPNIGGQTLIFLIGVGYVIDSVWHFKSFVLPELTMEAEAKLLKSFNSWISEMTEQYPNYLAFHWSSADPSFLRSAYQRHPNINANILRLFDVHHLFKTEPILIKGVFNFGLKGITDALSGRNLIPASVSYQNSECANGCQAMVKAWNCYRDKNGGSGENRSSGKIEENSEFMKIIKYNEQDCRSVYEIIKYLRLHHSFPPLKQSPPLLNTMPSHRYNLRKRQRSFSLHCIKCGARLTQPQNYQLCGDSYCLNQNEDSDYSPPSKRSRTRTKIVDSQDDEVGRVGRVYSDSVKAMEEEEEVEEVGQVDSEGEGDDEYSQEGEEDGEEGEEEDEEEDGEAEEEEEDEEEAEEKGEKGDEFMNKMVGVFRDGYNIRGEEMEQLKEILKLLKDKAVTVKKILNLEVPIEEKVDLFEKCLILDSVDPLTAEYKVLQDEINVELLSCGVIRGQKLTESEMGVWERVSGLLKEREPTLKKILGSKLSDQKKVELVEQYQIMKSNSVGTYTYNEARKRICKELEMASGGEKTYEQKIEESSMTKEMKMKLLDEVRNMDKKDSEYKKRVSWLEFVLKLPTKKRELPVKPDDNFEKLQEFSQLIRARLDNACYGMDEVKDHIIDFIFKKIANPNSTKHILALCGPKGVGKTQLAQALADVLQLPIVKICLGGATDSSKLIGHSYTYIGSIPGEIAAGMVQAECVNPIVYLDEVDKVCVRNGKYSEINGVLTHLLDPVQNTAFVDEYVGMPIDLSQVFWILTFNDEKLIDPIVRDRMKIIDVPGYKLADKIQISKHHLIPTIKRNLNIKGELELPDGLIGDIIGLTEKEEGVRSLLRNLEFLFERLNRLRLSGGSLNNVKIMTPTVITKEIIRFLIKSKSDSTFHPLYI